MARPAHASRSVARFVFPLLVVVIGVVGFLLHRTRESETPLEPIGPPLRVTTASGDALFLLTGHWRTTVFYGTRRSTATIRRTDLHVDLWRLDPATGRPVWRRAVLRERDGARAGLALLGASDDGETLWLVARGLRAARAGDGAVVLDPERLAAANPALRGLLPDESQWYALDSAGPVVTTTDARTHRIDAATFAARPVSAPAARDPMDAYLQRLRASTGWVPGTTAAFQARALRWPGRWLGLLADDEAATLAAQAAEAARPIRSAGDAMRASSFTTPGLDHGAPRRYRLWGARVAQRSRAPSDWAAGSGGDWGTRDVLDTLAPLPASPEFLQAGLLTAQPRTNATPIWLRGPDGVLVLHRDQLGEEGRLRLTRIAGPDGRAVWEAALPLSVLQAVLPGPPGAERTLVLFGDAYTPPTKKPRDPAHDAHTMVVRVDLETGAVASFDLTAEGPAIEARAQ